MRRETLLDIFQDFVPVQAPFLVHDDGFRARSFTYAETAAHARSFAARLQSLGIAPQDKVVFYSENRPEWIIALWACLLAGVIAVPIDFRSSPEFVRRIRDIVAARLILTGDEVEPLPDPGVSPIRTVLEPFAGALNPPPIAKDDTAEIIFTSGATADPKGVIITHRNVLANSVPVEREVLKYRKWSRPFAPIRFLNLLPLSHMFGQAMATFIPPMLPGVVVFMRGFSPSEIIRQIRSRRISVLVSVPKILEVLRDYLLREFPELAQPDIAPMHWTRRWWKYRRIHNLFGWKFWSFIVGAAPLPPELEAFWSRLGFLVVQGYGLTETAPIVTLNHPFHARKGSVGKPIGGVQVKIAADGEILVRGDNVTTGYFNAPEVTERAFDDGWFHTGDIGALDDSGELRILGRKKEMIVTPEGLNVFPEDVESALRQVPGVRDAAVIGTDRVHAVLILDPGTSSDAVVRQANRSLAEHQRIRSSAVWPYPEFPRTEGTGKLKRHEIAAGSPPRQRTSKLDLDVPLDSLTSLERVERMVALGMDESEFSSIHQSEIAGAPILKPAQPIRFPAWNRSWFAQAIRRVTLPLILLPLTRLFAHVRAVGLSNLRGLEPPVIFASTHQSYLDLPAILAALPAKWRYRVAPAMRKEFFDAHFHGRSFTNSLSYYLSTLFFNAFPIPQHEAGALETMRYMGELAAAGWCVLIFPEGKMTDEGEIKPFQPGIGMLGARLNVPVVPIRLEGLNNVLHKTWKMAKPGRVTIHFGPAIHLQGDDYAASARQVEAAARTL